MGKIESGMNELGACLGSLGACAWAPRTLGNGKGEFGLWGFDLQSLSRPPSTQDLEIHIIATHSRSLWHRPYRPSHPVRIQPSPPNSNRPSWCICKMHALLSTSVSVSASPLRPPLFFISSQRFFARLLFLLRITVDARSPLPGTRRVSAQLFFFFVTIFLTFLLLPWRQ